MTPAEKVFWKAVRARGFKERKFRRQQVIAGLIADFYCDECRLVVELDGGVHRDRGPEDRAREKVLRSLGLRVVRFTNEEVLLDLPGVLSRLEALL